MQFARKNFLIFSICGNVREITGVSSLFIMQIRQFSLSCQTLSQNFLYSKDGLPFSPCSLRP